MILVGITAALSTACSSREEKTKADCIRHTEAVWAMAAIYRMEHGTNADVLFTASLIEPYNKGPLYHCPLGTNDYPPFTYASGPRCPNAPTSHVGAMSPERSGVLK